MDDTRRIETRRNQGLLFLGLASAFVGFAMAIQGGLNANFLKDVMGLGAEQIGYMEAFRESCGIFALGLLALLAGFAEPLVGAAMMVVFAVGVGAYAYVPPSSFSLLIVSGMIWSQGLHIWMPLPNSMTLALAEPGQAGRRLGQVGAAGSAGAAAGFLAALGLDYLGVSMRQMYMIAAGGALLAAAMCLRIPRDIKTPGPRLVFRRKYWLYYLLCFLEGCRKQIFLAFSGYLLVTKFHAPVRHLLGLYVCVNAIGWVTSRPVGRLIDRVGERPVMLFYYGALTIFFWAYSVLQSQWMLYGLFVLDSSFFVFGMTLNTYVNHMAPKSEHTPTLSMGVAFNHVASVSMPLAAGLVWKAFGYEWAFRLGALVALVGVIPVLMLPAGRRGPLEEPAAAEAK